MVALCPICFCSSGIGSQFDLEYHVLEAHGRDAFVAVLKGKRGVTSMSLKVANGIWKLKEDFRRRSAYVEECSMDEIRIGKTYFPTTTSIPESFPLGDYDKADICLEDIRSRKGPDKTLLPANKSKSEKIVESGKCPSAMTQSTFDTKYHLPSSSPSEGQLSAYFSDSSSCWSSADLPKDDNSKHDRIKSRVYAIEEPKRCKKTSSKLDKLKTKAKSKASKKSSTGTKISVHDDASCVVVQGELKIVQSANSNPSISDSPIPSDIATQVNNLCCGKQRAENRGHGKEAGTTERIQIESLNDGITRESNSLTKQCADQQGREDEPIEAKVLCKMVDSNRCQAETTAACVPQNQTDVKTPSFDEADASVVSRDIDACESKGVELSSGTSDEARNAKLDGLCDMAPNERPAMIDPAVNMKSATDVAEVVGHKISTYLDKKAETLVEMVTGSISKLNESKQDQQDKITVGETIPEGGDSVCEEVLEAMQQCDVRIISGAENGMQEARSIIPNLRPQTSSCGDSGMSIQANQVSISFQNGKGKPENSIEKSGCNKDTQTASGTEEKVEKIKISKEYREKYLRQKEQLSRTKSRLHSVTQKCVEVAKVRTCYENSMEKYNLLGKQAVDILQTASQKLETGCCNNNDVSMQVQDVLTQIKRRVEDKVRQFETKQGMVLEELKQAYEMDYVYFKKEKEEELNLYVDEIEALRKYMSSACPTTGSFGEDVFYGDSKKGNGKGTAYESCSIQNETRCICGRKFVSTGLLGCFSADRSAKYKSNTCNFMKQHKEVLRQIDEARYKTRQLHKEVIDLTRNQNEAVFREEQLKRALTMYRNTCQLKAEEADELKKHLGLLQNTLLSAKVGASDSSSPDVQQNFAFLNVLSPLANSGHSSSVGNSQQISDSYRSTLNQHIVESFQDALKSIKEKMEGVISVESKQASNLEKDGDKLGGVVDELRTQFCGLESELQSTKALLSNIAENFQENSSNGDRQNDPEYFELRDLVDETEAKNRALKDKLREKESRIDRMQGQLEHQQRLIMENQVNHQRSVEYIIALKEKACASVVESVPLPVTAAGLELTADASIADQSNAKQGSLSKESIKKENEDLAVEGKVNDKERASDCKCKSMDEERLKYQKEVKQLSMEVERLKEALKKAQEEAEESKSKAVAEENKALHSSKAKESVSDKEIAFLRNRMQCAKMELGGLQVALDESVKEGERLRKTCHQQEEKLKRLTDTCNDSERIHGNLAQEIVVREDEIVLLKEKIQELEEEIGTLKQQSIICDQMRAEVDCIKEENRKLKLQLNNKQTSSAGDLTKDLTIKNERLSLVLDKLEEENEDLKRKLDQSVSEKGNVESTLENLKENMCITKKESMALAAEIENLTQEYQRVKDENERLLEVNEDAENRRYSDDQTEEMLRQREDVIDQLQFKMSAMQQQQKDMAADMTELISENEKLRENLKKTIEAGRCLQNTKQQKESKVAEGERYVDTDSDFNNDDWPIDDEKCFVGDQDNPSYSANEGIQPKTTFRNAPLGKGSPDKEKRKEKKEKKKKTKGNEAKKPDLSGNAVLEPITPNSTPFGQSAGHFSSPAPTALGAHRMPDLGGRCETLAPGPRGLSLLQPLKPIKSSFPEGNTKDQGLPGNVITSSLLKPNPLFERSSSLPLSTNLAPIGRGLSSLSGAPPLSGLNKRHGIVSQPLPPLQGNMEEDKPKKSKGKKKKKKKQVAENEDLECQNMDLGDFQELRQTPIPNFRVGTPHRGPIGVMAHPPYRQ